METNHKGGKSWINENRQTIWEEWGSSRDTKVSVWLGKQVRDQGFWLLILTPNPFLLWRDLRRTACYPWKYILMSLFLSWRKCTHYGFIVIKRLCRIHDFFSSKKSFNIFLLLCASIPDSKTTPSKASQKPKMIKHTWIYFMPTLIICELALCSHACLLNKALATLTHFLSWPPYQFNPTL